MSEQHPGEACGSCCLPSTHPPSVQRTSPQQPRLRPQRRHDIDQIVVPGGTFTMGDSSGDGRSSDGETPVHQVELATFTIDATTVTNAAFARFVAATGYRTEAETFGYSAVFHLAVAADPDDLMPPVPGTPWWIGVHGADWRHPGGRRSTTHAREDHPAVHVSLNDAQAYCT